MNERAFQDPPANARAIVEAQALSMQRHSDWIGERPRSVRVTGGALQAARPLGLINMHGRL